MEIHRSYFYYTEKKDDSEVEAAIRNAAEFGDGFWKIYHRLRREGYPWNRDNGPEFISKLFQEWCKENEINVIYIQPNHPTQNSIIERFNGSYRRAVLDAYIFRTIQDVRFLTDEWMKDYNENRPHESLNNMTPMEYREKRRVC